MTSIKAANAKEVASYVIAIANEKLKALKEATFSKKTIVSKGYPRVQKQHDNLVLSLAPNLKNLNGLILWYDKPQLVDYAIETIINNYYDI
uniref:Uncharacterized protein n=1 Tax=Lactuca sativa TaxID=4236 RepID=A0A9R1VRP9_LACSA|nr:hypothetical protein LSAT_V11C400186460 [Lactuca sativa]